MGIDRASLCGSMTIKDGMEVWQTFTCKYFLLKSPVVNYKDTLKPGGGGGGTWVFFGWVCAARDSKLAPRSKKNFP